MNKLKYIIGLGILLAFSFQTIEAQKNRVKDYDRMDEDLRIMEGIVDKLLNSVGNYNWSFNSTSRGFYLPEYGVIFSLPISTPMIQTMFLPSPAPVIAGGKGYSYAFSFGEDDDERSKRLKEAEEKYLEKTSVKIRDFLGIYADAIGQISKNEKISVYIYDSSDRTPLHLYSVLKSDIVKFKSGKIDSEKFNSKIEYVSLRDKDDMRSQIDIMTYVLDTALKSQARKSTEFRYSGLGVNGLYLDGFGALFLVNNRGNFFDRNFVVLEYDLMRLSEQQFEIDNLLRYKETKSYSSQKERIDSKKKALKKQLDDYKESIESYKKSFSTLLGNYGHTLRLVNQNEWLCVMTNWDESNRARRTDDILRSLIMRVKKRDVEQFASGKLSKEDFFKKISFTEY